MPRTLSIIEYSDTLAPDFYRINAQWIEAMFTMEDTDRETLLNPRSKIITPGGAILFAEVAGLGIVGTAALQKAGGQKTNDGIFELTKMGVLDSARGHKVGEYLLSAIIERAQMLNAQKLYLLTNTKCAAAIHLYEKAGFVHDAGIMADYGARYERCNVAMLYGESATL